MLYVVINAYLTP